MFISTKVISDNEDSQYCMYLRLYSMRDYIIIIRLKIVSIFNTMGCFLCLYHSTETKVAGTQCVVILTSSWITHPLLD